MRRALLVVNAKSRSGEAAAKQIREELEGRGFAVTPLDCDTPDKTSALIARDGPAYDVIVVEGAVSGRPDALLPLLKEGGRLVALVLQRGAGVAHVYVRSAGGVATRAEFNAALPTLASTAAEENFVF